MNIFADWYALIGAVSLWLNGGDPYGAYQVGGITYDAGYFAYPPPALLFAAPLTLLPWWLSALIVQSIAVVSFERWAWRMTGRSALVWVVLWPPLLQGLQIGQTTLLVLAVLLLAERDAHDRRDLRAGVLLALALLKPQVSILALVYLLLISLRDRRWRLIGAFVGTSAALWLGIALVAGPQIYLQWFNGLNAYSQALPDRPMIFLPLGPLVVVLAFWLWRRRAGDGFGLALLINTLIYPLSVLYIITPIAAVVIRWRPDWQLWALLLGWAVPVGFTFLPNTAGFWFAEIQAILVLGLLVGLLPTMHLLRRRRALAGPSGEAEGM